MSTKNFQVVEQIMPFYSTIYSDIIGVRMLILSPYAGRTAKEKAPVRLEGAFSVTCGDRD